MTPTQNPRTPIADAIASLVRDGMPVRFTAYDGSAELSGLLRLPP